MSYNISVWHTHTCTLTAPASALDSDYLSDVTYGKPGNVVDVTLSFDVEDEEITGTLRGDVLTLQAIRLRSSFSGTALYDKALPWLALTRGTLRAVLTWEDGDSISALEVIDGVATEHDIDVLAVAAKHLGWEVE